MRRKHVLVIIGLFLLYGITNYFLLLQNKVSVSYDEGIHLWTTLRFVRAFIYPTHNILYELFYADTTNWPPLFYFVASLFNLILGSSYITSVMTNMLFFLLLIISLYLIGRKIHSPSVGILAVIIVSFYPIIYGYSRLFLLDFALTACVTFSVYCLISSNRFKNLYWSIIFGVSAGMGMLIKWTFGLFILPLFVYIGIKDIWDIIFKKDSLGNLKNLLIAVTVSFLISSPWYLVNIDRSVNVCSYFSLSLERYLPDISWLVLTFNNNLLSFPFLLLFVFCLMWFYIKSDSGFKIFATIWCFIPILPLALVDWEVPRYLMPVVPCFALISAIGLNLINKRNIRNTLVLLIIVFGLMQYFSISFNVDSGKPNASGHFPKDMDIIYKPHLIGAYTIMGAAPPYRTDWKHKDIARSIASHAHELKDFPFTMGIIYEENDVELGTLFSNRVMNYYLTKELAGSGVILSDDIALVLNHRNEVKEFVKSATGLRSLLYISKNDAWPTLDEIGEFFRSHPPIDPVFGPQFEDNPAEDIRLIKLINSREKFYCIDKIELPHNYYAYIYLYKLPEIKKDDISVKIFNGDMKIFYKQKEITKETGVTSCFVYNSNTYFCKDAIWDIVYISPYQLKIVFEWPEFGIMQSTLVSMLDVKNALNIKAKLEVHKNITLGNWYVNSLLSDGYKEWVLPFSKGIFKEIPMFSNSDEYEPLDLGYNRYGIVGIKKGIKNDLPAILFKVLTADMLMKIGLSNTNYYENARCVYITADSRIQITPDKPVDILDLDIKILDDAELEDIISNIESESF